MERVLPVAIHEPPNSDAAQVSFYPFLRLFSSIYRVSGGGGAEGVSFPWFLSLSPKCLSRTKRSTLTIHSALYLIHSAKSVRCRRFNFFLLDQEFVDRHANTIAGTAVVVADGNLPPGGLARLVGLCRREGTPLVFEPTSVVKSVRPFASGVRDCNYC